MDSAFQAQGTGYPGGIATLPADDYNPKLEREFVAALQQLYEAVADADWLALAV